MLLQVNPSPAVRLMMVRQEVPGSRQVGPRVLGFGMAQELVVVVMSGPGRPLVWGRSVRWLLN